MSAVVSVIMPAYNAEKFIMESIESVRAQTFVQWELIIVDDGSTDSTVNIIRHYTLRDPRIKFFQQQHLGQGKARNQAIILAQSEILAFIDSDDLWMPHKLEKQIELLKETNAGLVFSNVNVINESGEVIVAGWNIGNKKYEGSSGIKSFFRSNKIPLLSAMCLKEQLLLAGGFADTDGSTQYGEDYDLWIRMLQSCTIFISSSEILASYRMHPNQSSKNNTAVLQVFRRLKLIQVTEKDLIDEKHIALQLWGRRFIKAASGSADLAQLKEIISIFSAAERFSFLVLLHLAGTKVVGKLILFRCKKAVRKISAQ